MKALPFIDKVITDSSLISYVKWEQTSFTEDPVQGNLTITFKASPVPYVYSNVQFDIVENLLTATSIGQYFSKNIKNIYSYTK